MPALYLRKVIHPQARDNYRVVLKDDGLKIEIGSIGNRVLGLGPRYRDPHEGNRITAHRQRPHRLHEPVSSGLGSVLCGSGAVTEFLGEKRKRLR